jgi:Protein of unknown function (DUF3106)
MTCLGKKRKLRSASPLHRGEDRFAFPFLRPVANSVLLLAVWMVFLACGFGWAAKCSSGPCPNRTNSSRQSIAWYQTGHTAAADRREIPGNVHPGPVPPQPEREHLGQWLRQHQNMSLAEQERALRTEPGFNRLPPARQQRLLERLQQLDAMPPGRRERMLERLETWERLSPEQRQQVRAGIIEVHQMPFDRQMMMHRAVRDLSEFPESQRGEILNSPEFRRHYSDYERQVLATLMMAQPYEPLRPQ